MVTVPRILVLAVILGALAGCTTLSDGDPGPRSYGAAASDIVWAEPYPNLTLEIDYVEALEDRGRAPTEHALSVATDTLRDVTAKRSIEIHGPEAFSAGDGGAERVWDFDEINELRQQLLDTATVEEPGQGENYTLHVVYLNGEREDDTVAGYSIGPLVVLFPDVYDVRSFLDPTLPPLGGLSPGAAPQGIENIERSVLVHEIGHSLGLVDNGAPMTNSRLHPDDDCRCHSRHEESVMFPFVRSQGALLEYLEENEHTPYRFDDDDRADLAALRALEDGS